MTWNGDCLSQYQIQVPEGRVSPDVLRLPVQDDDLPFTSAWRAKFNISNGNEEGHFDISTDPETNEGILNVIKVKLHRTHMGRGLRVRSGSWSQDLAVSGALEAPSGGPGWPRPSEVGLCLPGSSCQINIHIKSYF